MSKIICDVCGTSYPDTATQCPICGCVRSADAQGVSAEEAELQGGSGYTYVKGGRFSKSNVKKRNNSIQREDYGEDCDQQPEEEVEKEEKSSTGLLIVAILLLLAIVAVVIYIALHFFGPVPTTPTSTPSATNGSVSTVSPDVPGVKIPCTGVSLDASVISFKNKGATRLLQVAVQPENTTDKPVFVSSDTSVVTVDEYGLVTPVGDGQATITVVCGNVTASCMVKCSIGEPGTETTVPQVTEPTVPQVTEPTVPQVTEPAPTQPQEEEFKLNRKDITFSSKGESWMLYSGKLGLPLITWTSDNEAVATIKNGKAVAVGSGVTTVYGEYNGQKVGCIIRCSFEDGSENPGVGGNGGVTEDGGSSDNTGEGYRLKNMVGGRNDDVTITVGYSFSLQLVDGQGNPVSSVDWTSSNDGVCTVVDGKVTGVAAGLATITATYEGNTYKCVIHVN